MESFHNFLYEHPALYDEVFPDRISSGFFLGALKKYGPKPTQSVLDLGCGTGNTLEVVVQLVPESVGVDLLPVMVNYGKSVRPTLDLRIGDMRTIRLNRTFDGIGCFGWAFGYNLEDEDVQATLETCKIHAHSGTVLAFNCGHLEAYLKMDDLPEVLSNVKTKNFDAKSVSNYELDRQREILTRKRSWYIPGQNTIEDFCEYRLHQPEKLKKFLSDAGFQTMEMAGDSNGKPLYPGEKDLYVVAVKR